MVKYCGTDTRNDAKKQHREACTSTHVVLAHGWRMRHPHGTVAQLYRCMDPRVREDDVEESVELAKLPIPVHPLKPRLQISRHLHAPGADKHFIRRLIPGQRA